MATTTTLPAGTLKRVHVNRQRIERYVKTGVDEPAIIVLAGGKRYWGREVKIDGPCRFLQSLDKPMPGCSARIWMETRAAVEVLDAMEVPDGCDAER